MMYGEIERIKRTSLIKIPHSGRTIGRHRLRRQPWEGRSTHVCPLIHEVGRPEWLSRRLPEVQRHRGDGNRDRNSTRLNSSHGYISYAVFCLKKTKQNVERRVAADKHVHVDLALLRHTHP